MDAKSTHARVGRERAISPNTIQSTLERLYRKGLLQRTKVSHAYEYVPAVSRAELIGRVVESTVRRVGGNDPTVVLSAFVDLAARVGDEQLEQLQALISQRRAELGEQVP